jgi:hypothetical protein
VIIGVELRQCESLERKLSRHRNHLVFSLRCKDEGIIPPSLRIRCPIKTRKAQEIINKARKELLSERIHVTNRRVRQLKTQTERCSTALVERLPPQETEKITAHLQACRENEFLKTKNRHTAKLERLKASKPSDPEEIDLSGQQLKKWVINLSKYVLNEHETSALAKGLNYSITPKHLPVEDIIVATEQACSKLPTDEADQLRSKTINIISSAKMPTPNVTKDEALALRSLSKNQDIICLPPDKGKGVVILDKQEYVKKVQDMLADEVTYGKLQSDPTSKSKKKLVALLNKLLEEGKITDQQKRYLYPTTEVTPRLYCTPKIHKPNTPLRPIVDYTDSIGYAVSRSLADILAPMIGKTEHHIENVKDLAKSLATEIIKDTETFVSFDVTSLFTKTPIPQALEIIRQRLVQDKTLKQRTNLTVEDIMQLLTFIAHTTYFKFQGQVYQQKFGTAMGSPVSPLIANLFMEDLEEKAITTAPQEIRPRFWKRYVDDILAIVPRKAVPDLLNHLNSMDNTGSIKFTHEEMKDCHIPFLDADICVKHNGEIKLKIFRKPTHTNQYLSFHSHHHISHKMSVVRTLVDRAETVITEPEDKEKEMRVISTALKGCGYPTWTVEATQKAITEKKEKRKATADKKENNKGHVTIPYIRGTSERLRRVFKSHRIGTSFRPVNKISQLIIHPKDKIPMEEKCGVVYEVSCKNCDKSYIGETSRKLCARITEHKKDYEGSSTNGVTTRASHKQAAAEIHKSAITDHMIQENHIPDWTNTKVLSKETNNTARKIREAIWIRKKKNINRDQGAYHLSQLYNGILTQRGPHNGGGGPKKQHQLSH